MKALHPGALKQVGAATRQWGRVKMNRRIRMRIVAAITVLAWGALLIDITPWLFDMSADFGRLVLTIAGVGAVVLSMSVLHRPAAEVYQVGYDLGYSEGRRQGRTEKKAQSRTVVQFRRQA